VKNKLLVLFVLGTSLSAAHVYAHHSFAATYFEDRTVKIEGTLSQFLYRNPHSFVQVEVKDEKGEKQVWAIEWGAAGQLNLTGGKEALKFGDPVVVVGNPGRNPEAHRMRMVNIVRTSDGWRWGGSFN